jgi:putative membrane protein insertion efficiency factor
VKATGRSIAAGAIGLYQKLLSPLLPNVCRFDPSCSEYTKQAILKKGVLKGIITGSWRILRCNPFIEGGDDPVK